jgi:hypothetical protein
VASVLLVNQHCRWGGAYYIGCRVSIAIFSIFPNLTFQPAASLLGIDSAKAWSSRGTCRLKPGRSKTIQPSAKIRRVGIEADTKATISSRSARIGKESPESIIPHVDFARGLCGSPLLPPWQHTRHQFDSVFAP